MVIMIWMLKQSKLKTNMSREIDICSLCEISKAESKHHLIPKSKGGKETEGLCTDCHNQIHAVLTNKELMLEFGSIEKLKEFEQIKKWIVWRKKHPNVTVKHKMSKDRKKYGRFH